MNASNYYSLQVSLKKLLPETKNDVSICVMRTCWFCMTVLFLCTDLTSKVLPYFVISLFYKVIDPIAPRHTALLESAKVPLRLPEAKEGCVSVNKHPKVSTHTCTCSQYTS